MNHVRVGIYRLQEGASIAEIQRRVEGELLPLFRQAPGFIGFEGITTANGYFLSLSTWASQEQADVALATSGTWSLANLSFLATLADNYVGEYLFSHAAESHDQGDGDPPTAAIEERG